MTLVITPYHTSWPLYLVCTRKKMLRCSVM
ncbi:unnamed protein product, partial [Vitis vinifera]|uniref:Uncharacterized protein n=1 Tax=Vitis vinifera TaxID=29760 RepID=E0CS47_VITVI